MENRKRKEGIQNFFKPKPAEKKKATTASNPIVISGTPSSSSNTPSAPPPPKPSSRCGKYERLEKRLKALSRYKTEGDWRKHEKLDEKIAWTEIVQTFEHLPSKRKVEIWHFCPYGMCEYTAQQKSIPSCTANYNSLPKDVQAEMADLFTQEHDFNSDDVVVTTRYLFNICFPDFMKLASVCPIFKKNDKTKCENYRPISLLSNLSKTFERVMYIELQTF